MVEEGAKRNELQALLVDEDEQAADKLLREVLQRFVGLTREGRVVTKPQYLKLSHQNRLLVSLMARQAMVRLGLPSASVEASAEVLEREAMVPLKSCREYLSKLKKARLLDKNERGYFVPLWSLSNVAGVLGRGA